MTDQAPFTTTILWVARISGSLILAFILFFILAYAFGEDESGEGFRSTAEFISFLFFPVSTAIGLSLALKWEGMGGLITLCGMIGLFILRPDLLKSIFMMIPVLPAALYLLFWHLKNKQKRAVQLP